MTFSALPADTEVAELLLLETATEEDVPHASANSFARSPLKLAGFILVAVGAAAVLHSRRSVVSEAAPKDAIGRFEFLGSLENDAKDVGNAAEGAADAAAKDASAEATTLGASGGVAALATDAQNAVATAASNVSAAAAAATGGVASLVTDAQNAGATAAADASVEATTLESSGGMDSLETDAQNAGASAAQVAGTAASDVSDAATSSGVAADLASMGSDAKQAGAAAATAVSASVPGAVADLSSIEASAKADGDAAAKYLQDTFTDANDPTCTLYKGVAPGCSWTSKWSCPGQALGTDGAAKDDGSHGYQCCCAAAR